MSTTRKMLIMFGAPLVLVGGLGVYWGLQKGSAVKERLESWVDQLEHSSQPVAMQVGGFPIISQMHVDGERIGKLDTVVVLRSRPGTVDSLRLVVLPAAGVPLGQFEKCEFQIEPHAMEGTWPPEGYKHLVHCVADTTGLVSFGTMVFAGAGLQSRLYLAKDDLPCAHMSDPNSEACSDLRTKMQGLRDEIRTEIRQEIRKGTKGDITVDVNVK